MRLALGVIGFTSIIGQVLLMRELVAVFYGNELVFGLILAFWLLWVAVGSWGLARIMGRWRLGRGAFAVGLILASLFLPAQITLTRAIRKILDITPGAFVGFGPMVWAILLILAPLCLLLGFQFILGARLLTEEGDTAGGAYVYESVGAVVGGALFSFLLVLLFDPFQVALGLGAVNLAVGTWVAKGEGKLAIPFGVSALLFAVLALSAGTRFHHRTLGWQWQGLVFAQDSRYGRLTVTARDGQRAFFENGLLMFETQGTFPEEVIHFPLLMHPQPETVLLIGGGVSGDLREVLKHPVREVHYVELDPLVVRAAQTHLPPIDALALDDPRVHLVHGDGRLYVKESDQAFDLVVVDLPEPATGQLNRFYTQEFFQEVRRLLKEEGVLSLGVPSAENYWSPEIVRRNGTIYHTLRSVFGEVIALPGDHNFFLASDSPLVSDPLLLIQRLEERRVETRWVTSPYINYVFTTDRFQQARQDLEGARGIKLNRDLVPICYYYDMVLWLSLFYSGLSRAFEAASLLNLAWLVVPLALLVFLLRGKKAYALPVVVAFIGFAGMALELVVLFAFQVLKGYVYHEVGLIITAFMAGLALGAGAANRYLQDRGARLALLSILATTAVYALSIPLALSISRPIPDLTFPCFTLLAGFLGGACFPLAVASTKGGVARAVGLIYGADLVGGCLGAALVSGLFIPVLGLPQTCYAVALLALAGIVLLL